MSAIDTPATFAGSYFVGYLNGTTGGFGASYLFMAGSLFLSAILTIIAVKDAVKLNEQYVDEKLAGRVK